MVLTLAHHAGERALHSRQSKPIAVASLRPCPTVARQHPLACLDARAFPHSTRARTLRCRSSTEQANPEKAEADTKIKQTLADLDALLGIEEEKKEEKKQEPQQVAAHLVITS